MNKAYRVVWSHARQALVVAHEKASSGGKRSSTKTLVTQGAVTAALLLASHQASAQTIFLPANSQLTVSSTIQGTSGYAGVQATAGGTSGAITNTGTILGSPVPGDANQLDGVYVGNSTTLGGGITNSGTASAISGVYSGIAVVQTGSVSTIYNSGTITSSSSGTDSQGIMVQGGVVGAIVNVSGGLIGGQAQYGIQIENNGVVNSIGNAAGATISGAGANGAGILLSSHGVVSGNVVNAGLITGGEMGVNLSSNSTIAGAIMNTGTVSGGTFGVYLDGSSSIGNGITNAGLIAGPGGAGVYASAASIGPIVNLSGGVISGATGISLQNYSTVSGITNSGLIGGINAGLGIDLGSAAEGSIVNQAGGTISGTYYGLYLVGASITGGITNSGLISNSASNTDAALYLYQSNLQGGIANLASGVITGASGIDVIESTLDFVNNAGTVTTSQYALALEQSTLSGGVTNSGTLVGGYAGLVLTESFLSHGVTNSGLITGAEYAGLIVAGGTISGGIANLSGGVISGASGVSLYETTVDSIFNAAGATISGLGGGCCEAIAGIGVHANSTVTGGIVNDGLIQGTGVGIELVSGATVAGGILNQGVITGGTIGVSLNSSGFAAVLNNGITNVGANALISGGNTGIAVGTGSTLSGGIINSGTITGGSYGISLLGRQQSGQAPTLLSGGITNSGTISGAQAGIFISTQATAPVFSGGISNSGLISGTSVAGIVVVGADLAGGIANSGGGVITGGEGILLAQSSTDAISNAAGSTISGTNGNAIDLSASTVAGVVGNAGVIQAQQAAISLSTAALVGGGITNSGSMVAGAVGINAVGASTIVGAIVNQSGGTISGGNSGIALVGSTVSGALVNGGVIAGGAYGVNNNGGVVGGGITNSGRIAGGTVGIALTGAAQVAGALVNQAGATISGGNTGIGISGSSVTGVLSNAGTIAGGKYAVNVDSASTLGQIAIVGNGARFAGDLVAPNTAVTVTSGTTYTGVNAFDVASFTVAGGAALDMGAMASSSGGASGITGAVSNNGAVSIAQNQASITGSYTQAAGAEFSLGVASATSYGQLHVNGAVNLPQADQIAVDVASTATLTNKETLAGVITSTALTASSFEVTDNSALYSFTGLIDGNNVDLVVALHALVLPDVLQAHNSPAVGAATALDTIIEQSGGSGTFGNVISALGRLQTAEQVSNAASQTLPLLLGENSVATLGALWDMNHVVQSRLEGSYGLSSGDGFLTDRGVWVKPFGSSANQSGEGADWGFSSSLAGIVFGADGAYNDRTRVGLAFAYGEADVSGANSAAPSSDKINLYQLIGYGTFALDARTEINVQIDGGQNTNSGSRDIRFVGESAKSTFDTSTAHAGIGIGHSLPLSPDTVFTPSVRLDYTWLSNDAYSEGGAGPLDLHAQSTSLEQLLTSFNGKLTQRISDDATLFGDLGIGYDALARNTSVTAAFAGAPGLSFSTPGVGTKPVTTMGGLGLIVHPHGNVPELSLQYGVQHWSGFTDQSVSFKARWAF